MDKKERSNCLKIVDHEELSRVHGRGLVSWAKKAYRWAKKHLVVTKKSIGIKGKHNVGGG